MTHAMWVWAVAIGLPAIENPGFEAPRPVAGWTSHVYKSGKDPVIRLDTEQFHEGRQSLLVEATDPSDVALGQTLVLPIGSLWRISCWIRTDNLQARDPTQVGGTFQIQTPTGTIASPEGRFGTSDWRRVEALIRVPSPGEIRVSLFFIGFGKGTGRAWFDDVRLEPVVPAAPQKVRISSRKLSRSPINLKQGGQFIEPLCYLIPAMTAQQVADTSFEEEPPWKVAYKREIDKPHRPWYPVGTVHLAQFALDEESAFNGKRSQRIDLPAPGCRVGLSQDGFSVAESRLYHLRLHMRGTDQVPVRASLHAAGRCLAGPVALGRAGDAWQPAAAKLKPARTSDNATLTIEFDGPGTVWLDRIYLIDQDAVLGIWRPDVAAVLKEMNPGVIRWGGSAMEAFEWDQCIGSWDRRVPYPTCWGGLEPNFVGVEEFIQLCRQVGAEPLICVRWTGKKPEHAAAQVEYFNAPPETTWGKRRAGNGHPDPYAVKYWQIGNEIGGQKYDASVKAFAEAMKKADPTIRILSSFPSADTLQRGQGYLDYLCPHHYGCADLVGKQREFDFLQDQIARFSAGRDVRVAVTEWNTTAGDWGLGRGTLQTLSNALWCSRYHNLMHRRADLVEIAIRSNLVDSFGSGVIQTGPGWMYLAPTYHAQKLYARSAGSFPLTVERSSDLPWHLCEPDISAVLTEDDKTLRIYAVNSTADPLEVRFLLTDLPSPVRAGTVSVLKDSTEPPCVEAMNTRDEPDRITLTSRPANLTGNNLPVVFDPFSLTLLELQLAG